MILLHRIGHQAEEFHLNPDLIVTVEANPDTVITLTTGTKIVVAETPERVTDEIRAYRVEVLSGSLNRRRAEGAPQPHGISARRAAQGMLVALDRSQDATAGPSDAERDADR
jgi:flagellar protein FlbD